MKVHPVKKKHNWDIDHIDLRTPAEPDKVKKGFLEKLKHNWKKILIFLLVAYLAVVLYGLATTRFYQNDAGQTVAYRLSFLDLKKQDDYHALKTKLTDIRNLIRDITIIDIHLANGDYTNYEAATLYTKILNDKLDVLIPKVKAMNLQDGQASIQKEFECILSYDLALYLQNIIKGLQGGDVATVQTALAYRDKALGTYQIIETDIRGVADSLKIEDEDFFSWELNAAVTEEDKTATLKKSGDIENE